MTESRCANNLDVVEDALGESMARRLAAVISHAPGFSGMPSSGQSSSAVIRASWASSSATPISWVTRAMAAMSRVDSIFQTASIALGTSSCLLDYGVPVFTDDVASLNYPVFKGPATL